MKYWYYDAAGNKRGPYSTEDIRVFAKMKVISENSIIENEQGKKCPAKRIPGLFHSSPQLPQPIPVPQRSPHQNVPPPAPPENTTPTFLQWFVSIITLQDWREKRNAKRVAKEIIEKAHAERDSLRNENEWERSKTWEQVNELLEQEKELKLKLVQLENRIGNAHKDFRFRKNLPDTHEKLQKRFNDLQEKHKNLQEKHKESKSAAKVSGKIERLARSYVEDTFRYAVSKMTINNYISSRERVFNVIQRCVDAGITFPSGFEQSYHKKLEDEYKKVLSIDKAKIEQQRAKEQLREEQRKNRYIEQLRKKQLEEEKNQEEAKRERARLQAMIDVALNKANGIHTEQIKLMEKQLADRDAVIAAKQQEIDDNQRAISNAQMTKAGHVYVLSNIGSFGKDVFKIGMTRRDDPQDRVNELGDASVPFPFDVHLMVYWRDAPGLENALHRAFHTKRVNRVNFRKEYFRVNVNEVKQTIERYTGQTVDYVADPRIFENYADQYRDSQTITLEQMQEVEKLLEQAGVDLDDD